MRKIIIGVALVFSLTACSDYRQDDAGNPTQRNVIVQQVEVDGEDVNCVIYDDDKYEQGGISCDFGNPTEDYGP